MNGFWIFWIFEYLTFDILFFSYSGIQILQMEHVYIILKAKLYDSHYVKYCCAANTVSFTTCVKWPQLYVDLSKIPWFGRVKIVYDYLLVNLN